MRYSISASFKVFGLHFHQLGSQMCHKITQTQSLEKNGALERHNQSYNNKVQDDLVHFNMCLIFSANLSVCIITHL